MPNRLLTLDEVASHLRAMWRKIVSEIPTDMFIEGQYNWERAEFDEHG